MFRGAGEREATFCLPPWCRFRRAVRRAGAHRLWRWGLTRTGTRRCLWSTRKRPRPWLWRWTWTRRVSTPPGWCTCATAARCSTSSASTKSRAPSIAAPPTALPTADCRTGTLVQFDLAGQTSTTRGGFSGVADAPSWSLAVSGREGQLGGTALTAGAPNTAVPDHARRDVWLFNPGVAGSLRRVTNHMP